MVMVARPWLSVTMESERHHRVRSASDSYTCRAIGLACVNKPPTSPRYQDPGGRYPHVKRSRTAASARSGSLGEERGVVARVDPDYNRMHRYVVRHHRYDPEGRERRYAIVAAFYTRREFAECCEP
jgi:hypothetical protein